MYASRTARSKTSNRLIILLVFATAMSLLAALPTAAQQAPSSDSFVLFAEESIAVDQNSTISGGDVGVNQVSDAGPELTLGQNVVLTDNSTTLYADTVHLGPGVVANDIFTNDLQGEGTVAGAVTPATFPLVTSPVPPAPVAPGPEIDVGSNSSASLEPGAYGDLSVGKDASLTLEPGDYTFASWSVGAGVAVTAEGSVSVVVEGNITVGKEALIVAGRDETGQRLDFAISSGTTVTNGAVDVGRESFIETDIAVFNGVLHIGRDSDALGVYRATAIAIDQGTSVTFVESDTPPVDTTPPLFVSSSPADGDVVPAGVGDVTLLITFSEPMAPLSIERSLVIAGDVTGLITPSDVVASDADVVVTLGAGLPDREFTVTVSTEASDVAGNLLETPVTWSFTVERPARFTGSSPVGGDESVSVERSLVVEFSAPLDETSIDPSDLLVSSADGATDVTLDVDATGRRLYLFPVEPLPPAATITLQIVGDGMLDAAGNVVDGDADGVGGGTAEVKFRTVSTQNISGTTVFGYVLDAYGETPIEGVTVRIDGPSGRTAVTDATGYFQLDDTPAPDFFVTIDGSTAINTAPGASYPILGKVFHSVAGESRQVAMNGEPFDIYLPAMADGDVVTLSTTEDTVVPLGPAGKASLIAAMPEIDPAQWDLVEVLYPAGSAIADDGTPATQATVIPVPPERIPAPLPPGLDPELVVSIQAFGATRFDSPGALTMPNLADLDPGSKSSLFAFNHDAGRWEYRGTATVAADRLTVSTDPGVGITAPGWFSIDPTVAIEGRGIHTDMAPVAVCDDTVWSRLLDESGYPAAANAGVAGAGAVYQYLNGGSGSPNATFPVLYDRYEMQIFVGDGPAPPFEDILEAFMDDPNAAVDEPIFDATAVFSRRGNTGTPPQLGEVYDLFFAPLAFLDIIDANANQSTGSLAQTERLPADPDNPHFRFSTIAIPMPGGGFDTHPEWGSREFGFKNTIDGWTFYTQAVTRPDNRFIQWADWGRPPTWLAALAGVRQTLEALGYSVGPTDSVAFAQAALPDCYQPPPGTGVPPGPTPSAISPASDRFFYRIEYHDETLEQQSVDGQTDFEGRFRIIVPADTSYTLMLWSAETNRYGTVSGQTPSAGVEDLGDIPVVYPMDLDTEDADGDTLALLVEILLRTDPNDDDTDDDGVDDGTEVKEGTDPRDPNVPTGGTIAGVTFDGGFARSIVADDGFFVASTDRAGVRIYDVSKPKTPILQSVIDYGDTLFPGALAWDAERSQLVVGAGGFDGSQIDFYDLTDRDSPVLLDTIVTEAVVQDFELMDDFLFAANQDLLTIDLEARTVIGATPLGDLGSGAQMSRLGTTVYLNSGSGGGIFDVSFPTDPVSLGDGLFSGEVSMDVGQDFSAWATDSTFTFTGGDLRTFDISDPTNVTLLARFPSVPAGAVELTSRQQALVGKSAFSQLSLIDSSDPADPTNVLESFDLSTVGAANLGVFAIRDAGGGIAYVGTFDAIDIVRYGDLDTGSVAPTVDVQVLSPDEDDVTSGVQVGEGRPLALLAVVTDDVDVRSVELIIDGEPMALSEEYPFQFFLPADQLDADTTIEFEAVARDSAGNSTLSALVEVDIVRDDVAPSVVSSTPATGGSVFAGATNLDVGFSEPLDPATIDETTIRVVGAGDDGSFGTGDDTVVVPNMTTKTDSFATVAFEVPPLRLGVYRFELEGAALTDVAGNALSAGLDVIEFDVVADPVPIAVDFTMPADGGFSFAGTQSLSMFVTKPLDDLAITLAPFELTRAGPDGVFDTADDVPVPLTSLDIADDLLSVIVRAESVDLATSLRWQVDEAAIVDLSGNTLGTGTLVISFVVDDDVGG